MREVERSAASVEEAIEAALAELGVSEQEAEVEIVREAQRGMLGLGSRDAVVRVRTRVAVDDEGVPVEEQAEVATDFLEGLLQRMGIPAEVEVHSLEGATYVEVVSEEQPDTMGLLIGRRGQTLDALQELVRAVVQRRTKARCRLLVDVEDYRKRRRSQLAERAREVAERVKRTGKKQGLEPMNAYERKIVHDAVAEVGGVESSSEGEDPQRRVVIRKRR